jgi:hypothetical protein
MADLFDHPDTARILAFLGEVGIATAAESLPDGTLLPGIDVRGGTVVFDPARLTQPGDLLHEAGHVAVAPADERHSRTGVPDDPGEEMAAIAWSYAAAVAIGVDSHVLFHEAGYRGAAATLADQFTTTPPFGVPLLAWYGLTDTASYPRMTRWLR